MKKCFTLLILAGTLVAGAAVVIDDFENEKPDGWNGYKDAQSGAPVLSVTDDTLSGNGALKVVFLGCKQYQGIQFYKAPVMPEKCVGVSFLIKAVAGPPPAALALSEQEKRYGKDIATGAADFKTGGNDWQKVTVLLADMKYGSGSERGKAFPFKTGAIYLLRFYGPVSDQPSVFLIDDLAWETE